MVDDLRVICSLGDFFSLFFGDFFSLLLGLPGTLPKCSTGRLKAFLNGGNFSLLSLTVGVRLADIRRQWRWLHLMLYGCCRHAWRDVCLWHLVKSNINIRHAITYFVTCCNDRASHCNNVSYWNNLASYWSTVTDCINRQVTAIMRLISIIELLQERDSW